MGLLGSNYYTSHPIFPVSQSVADLNIDMIGRIDTLHPGDSNYVYLIGSNRLSTELHNLSEEVNATHTHLSLDYTYNDPKDPNQLYYRSDHYNFAKLGIPVIFYFTGLHEDYHKITDTPEKLLYTKTAAITKLVFLTAWQLAHQDHRIQVDVKQ
jgi:Zn-dependent M28 family amino/carboxypeptidase